MDRMSILVVENNSTDRSFIKECLMKKPHTHPELEIMEAENLSTALGMLTHYAIDAIIIDLFLPDSEGLETLRKIIYGYPEAVVVAVSDREDIDLGVHCIRYGAQDHIEKKYLSPFVMNKSLMYAIERKSNMLEKEELLSDLSHALKHLEYIEHALPLCPGCKKIQNATGNWVELDEYLCKVPTSLSEVPICPDCKMSQN